METSFKSSHAVPPTLQQATADSYLCQRLLDTHGQVWISLLWGHCSFLLGPGAHSVMFVPSKSLFTQSCISSGGSMVGLMATSSKRAYTIPRSTAPRAPAPAAARCCSVPPQRTLKHSSASVSVGSLVPGVHKACLSPLSVSGGYGFDSKCNFTPPTYFSISYGRLYLPLQGLTLTLPLMGGTIFPENLFRTQSNLRCSHFVPFSSLPYKKKKKKLSCSLEKMKTQVHKIFFKVTEAPLQFQFFSLPTF